MATLEQSFNNEMKNIYICQQLGCNSGYINKLLNGNADPSYKGVLELAEYFNVEIGELFGEK